MEEQFSKMAAGVIGQLEARIARIEQTLAGKYSDFAASMRAGPATAAAPVAAVPAGAPPFAPPGREPPPPMAAARRAANRSSVGTSAPRSTPASGARYRTSSKAILRQEAHRERVMRWFLPLCLFDSHPVDMTIPTMRPESGLFRWSIIRFSSVSCV